MQIYNIGKSKKSYDFFDEYKLIRRLTVICIILIVNKKKAKKNLVKNT